MGDLRDHWEGVYSTKSEGSVSWYQRHSNQSLAYVTAAAGPASQIIDIGGGASTLVDDLLERGYANVTVLDIADAALAKARSRLGGDASRIRWIVADVTRWQPPRSYDVWHDRAVFHFLNRADDQEAYIAALRTGTEPGATVIMATFALDGPEKCSSLPVQRYSPKTLADRIGPPFVLVDQAREMHRTPWETEQPFTYCVFRRR